jgi:outer membrane protein OmpA-like peptidoglycan-associated protein
MRRLQLVAIAMYVVTGCGGSQSGSESTGSGSNGDTASQGSGSGGTGDPARDGEFQVSDSDTAGQAHGDRPSEIEATETLTAMRLFVVNPDTGPIPGIVIKMTAPDGTAYFTRETDSVGYAEVLVPNGQRYEMEYLSLGRRNTTASVDVAARPNQDLRLTMRYRRERPEPEEAFVFEGVFFNTNRATIQAESFPRLDRVVEYMTHRSTARIRVSGHTDNVGNPRRNQQLSEARAEAVRTYLVEHGIDESRVEAIGYGDERPIASNDTEEGKAQNRRIEAVEL